MGLLDVFLKGTGDPERDAAINSGLLNAGLALMQARGRLFPALGQAGQVGVQAMQQTQQQQEARKRAGLQDQLLKNQLAGQQREQEMAALPGQFYRAPSQPGVDATGGMETAAEAPNNASGPGGFDMQGYIQALMAKSPMQALQLKAATAQQEPKLHTFKPGEVGGTFQGGQFKPVFTAPEKADKPERTPLAKLLEERAGLPAGSPLIATYNDAIKKATTHQEPTRVNVGLKQEGAFATGQGKEFSEMMGGINKTSFTAPAQLRKLERLSQLLDGVDGGKLAPLGLEVASAANSLGLKIDPKLGNKEAAQALSREIAGGFRQPGTGPMTDKDFDNFLLQVPDLSKSAQGRKQITKTMSAALARDIELGKMARAYVAKNGQLDNGFLEEASQFVAQNPVVGMPEGWKVQR